MGMRAGRARLAALGWLGWAGWAGLVWRLGGCLRRAGWAGPAARGRLVHLASGHDDFFWGSDPLTPAAFLHAKCNSLSASHALEPNRNLGFCKIVFAISCFCGLVL